MPRFLFIAAVFALSFFGSDEAVSNDKFVNVSPGAAREMVGLVRASGYECKEVDLVSRCLTEECFRIACDSRWVYFIYRSNRGGFEVRTE